MCCREGLDKPPKTKKTTMSQMPTEGAPAGDARKSNEAPYSVAKGDKPVSPGLVRSLTKLQNFDRVKVTSDVKNGSWMPVHSRTGQELLPLNRVEGGEISDDEELPTVRSLIRQKRARDQVERRPLTRTTDHGGDSGIIDITDESSEEGWLGVEQSPSPRVVSPYYGPPGSFTGESSGTIREVTVSSLGVTEGTACEYPGPVTSSLSPQTAKDIAAGGLTKQVGGSLPGLLEKNTNRLAPETVRTEFGQGYTKGEGRWKRRKTEHIWGGREGPICGRIEERNQVQGNEKPAQTSSDRANDGISANILDLLGDCVEYF
jgi:hypothetical protein